MEFMNRMPGEPYTFRQRNEATGRDEWFWKTPGVEGTAGPFETHSIALGNISRSFPANAGATAGLI